jgi:AcrR family transcriptional regulator
VEVSRSHERRPAKERRAQILAAAIRCIGDKGYHAATMDDLARASGLSKGSLYWHFESKEDVFLALCDAVASATFEAWDARGEDGSTFDRFDAVVSETLEGSQLMDLRPVWAEFFTHPRCRDRIAEVYGDMRARLAAEFERAGAAGGVRRGTPAAAAALLVAAVEGLGLQAMVDAEFDLKSHWAASVEVLRGGFE